MMKHAFSLDHCTAALPSVAQEMRHEIIFLSITHLFYQYSMCIIAKLVFYPPVTINSDVISINMNLPGTYLQHQQLKKREKVTF